MVLFALSLLACGRNDSDIFGSDVIPQQEQVEVNFPDASDAAKSPSDLDDWAMYYDTTRNVTEHVNGLITAVLGLTWGVVSTQDPSWSDESEQKAVWGPYKDSGLDPVSVGVYVERNEDESYAWAVFFVPNGGTVEEDAVPVVAGEVDAGSTRDAAAGTFYIDFDTAASMDPSVNHAGTFAVEYAYDAEGVNAVAFTENYGWENGPRHDAAYAYEQDTEGAGTMDLAYLADVNLSGTDEVVTLRSRWQADGMGRGDSQILGGDLEAEVVESSECWGTDFKTSYWVDSIGLYETVGEESVCAFTPAQYAEEASFSLAE